MPSETWINPSTEFLAKFKISSLVYLTELPLQNLLAFSAVISLLFLIELEKGVAMSV